MSLHGGSGGQVGEESPLLAASPGSESLARKATRSHWPISFELSKNCLSSPFNVVLLIYLGISPRTVTAIFILLCTFKKKD